MRSERQDAWTKEEDALLAEIVLDYIHHGKTQLEAFKHIGKQLSRTPAACGFRWNAQIRKQYTDAILTAKAARKQRNHVPVHQVNKNLEQATLEQAISFFETIRENVHQATSDGNPDQENYIIQLKKDNQQLKQDISRYKEAWTEMGKLWEWIEKEGGHF